MIGLNCSESIRRRESWENYIESHIILFKENNCLLKKICNANTAAGRRGDLSRSPNGPLGFLNELKGFLKGLAGSQNGLWGLQKSGWFLK